MLPHMQRVIRFDGSVVEPPPLRLGVLVDDAAVEPVRAAMAQALLDGEHLLAIVRLISEDPWEVFFVLSSHHYSRVAFAQARQEARVLSVAGEHSRGGVLEQYLHNGEAVLLGLGLHAKDGEMVYGCLPDVGPPPGSDGRHVFVEDEAVRSWQWRADENTTA